MKARGWALTDVGRKRDHNEDSFLCNNELSLFAVADGMGGHLGGERASRMAVEILEREVGTSVGQGLTGDGGAAAGRARNSPVPIWVRPSSRRGAWRWSAAPAAGPIRRSVNRRSADCSRWD